MNKEEIVERIANALPPLRVVPVSDQTYRITIPTYRGVHDVVAFALTETEAGWTLSDGGQLAFLLEDDYERVIGAMECAGATLQARDGNVVEYEVMHEDALADALFSFSYYLAAAPVVWHSLNCARGEAAQPSPSVDIMARETRSHIVRNVGERRGAFVRLKHTVTDHGESFPAPLAIAAPGTTIRPTLLASFIDPAAPKTSVTTAKRNTAYFWNIVRDWSTTRKYVVVRDQTQVEHFAELYDRDRIVTISTEDFGPLLEDADAAIAELLPQ